MRRTGYNILGEFLTPPTGDIRPAILSHLAAYRPTVITIMDNPAFAVEALEATGGETMVIHRHYHQNEGHLFDNITPEIYADYITYHRTLDKRLWVQVWNEPSTDPKNLPILLNQTIAVAEILTQWGYRGVLGNIGTATIQPETIASGMFDEYLRRLAEWSANSQHVAGYHEYTAALAPFGVGYWSVDDLRDPLKMQPENWPEIEETTLEDLMIQELAQHYQNHPHISVPAEPAHYWHIRRLEWLQERALLIGEQRHKYVITENPLDRMGDVSIIYPYLEQTYGAVSDVEIKGAPTLEKVWAGWWPYWSRDEALAQQCWWLERNYDPDCIGWCIFCFCRDAHMQDKEQRWEPGYDISDWYAFQQLMVANRDTPAKPEPTPNPDPLPDDTPEAEPWMVGLMLFICACVILALLYTFTIAPNRAQEVQQMEVISITEAGNILMAAIGAILAGGLAAPVTTPAVNLVKAVLKVAGLEDKVGGDVIAMVVAVVVTVAMWLSRHFGMELQATTVMDWLVVAIPPFIQVLSLFAAQKGIFALSQRLSAPGYGYTRSE